VEGFSDLAEQSVKAGAEAGKLGGGFHRLAEGTSASQRQAGVERMAAAARYFYRVVCDGTPFPQVPGTGQPAAKRRTSGTGKAGTVDGTGSNVLPTVSPVSGPNGAPYRCWRLVGVLPGS